MDITSLIEKCKENDRNAQAALYQQYKVKLFAQCLKYCKNLEEAEDTLQESFIAILTKIHQYSGRGSFEGWMTRITINHAINKYKKQLFNEPIYEDTLTFENIEIEPPSHSLAEILSMVQELPNQYRLVFNLYELDKYSHKEIAKMLNIAETTSKSNLHRAKRLLQKALMKKEKSATDYGK